MRDDSAKLPASSLRGPPSRGERAQQHGPAETTNARHGHQAWTTERNQQPLRIMTSGSCPFVQDSQADRLMRTKHGSNFATEFATGLINSSDRVKSDGARLSASEIVVERAPSSPIERPCSNWIARTESHQTRHHIQKYNFSEAQVGEYREAFSLFDTNNSGLQLCMMPCF